MNQRHGAQQRTSATAVLPAERSTHTQSPLRRAQQSTANHRPAANMLGQPGQSFNFPYKRQPVYRATHRCVSQSLYQHMCGLYCQLKHFATTYQQLEEIKCFIACCYVFVQSIWEKGRIYMHAEKCLSSMFVAGKASDCFEKAIQPF